MTNNRKVGLVSSFDVLCGNATFSEALAVGLSKYCTVERIELPASLQKKHDERRIDDLVKKIKELDSVNFQFEMGLYGPSPWCAVRNAKKMIGAAKVASVTMHRIDEGELDIIRSFYNAFKARGIRFAIRQTAGRLVRSSAGHYYVSLLRFLEKRRATVIVHTYREQKLAEEIAPGIKCVVHPIVWPEFSLKPVDVGSIGFKNNYPVLGLFGFVSEYKNFEMVARSLKNLNFNILLCGSTHPMAPNYGRLSSAQSPSYFRRLSNVLSESAYAGRVVNILGLSDDEFASYMRAVDIVCVPYLETGQSGSGIASMALQYGRAVLFSDTHCTTELARFLNQKPIVFDCDSPISLTSALERVLREYKTLRFDGYDFQSQIELYRMALNHFPSER